MSNLISTTELESERPRVIRGVRISYDDKKSPVLVLQERHPVAGAPSSSRHVHD